MAGEIMTHLQLAQVFISGGAGLVGVGIGIGIFKRDIKQIKKDIDRIIKRQDILRGNDNGKERPLYVSLTECIGERARCVGIKEGKFGEITVEMKEHRRSIKALENFARWWMQKEGLNIREIQSILTNQK